jgi:hypothetical protein
MNALFKYWLKFLCCFCSVNIDLTVEERGIGGDLGHVRFKAGVETKFGEIVEYN